MGLKGDTYVHEAANTHPRMDAFYVFVSRDEQGRENVLGSLMGSLGTQALATGNERVLEIFKQHVRKARAATGGKQTIHLLKFTNREELEF